MKTHLRDKVVWLNYHHLYYFMLIASEGSIAKAAQRLGLGQPALSIQLKQFEESLGVKLFERAHKKLTLTEYGKAALEYAREIFKLGGEMLETLNDSPSKDRVHLQVGALDTIPKHLTVRLAEEAMRFRSCTISILEGRGDELARELARHRIDLLLTNRVVHASPTSFYMRKIASLPLMIVGASKFLPLKKRFPESLQKAPFILPTAESQVRHAIEHYCKLHGLYPDFQVECQDVMVQKLLALNGFGLIAAPQFAVKEYLDGRRLHVIGKPKEVIEEIYLVAASRKIENPVATHLMKTFSI